MQNDEEMSKYGVNEGVSNQEELEKKSSDGCPICGKTPEKQGGILICPTHGTEPFE